MPIDRRRYHRKWSLISRLVRLRRARNTCEHCQARNGEADPISGRVVQLGTAHLDQDPSNNRFSNLRCLCRACHLAYDRRYNIGKAIITRRYGKDKRQLRLPFQLNIPFKHERLADQLGEEPASGTK